MASNDLAALESGRRRLSDMIARFRPRSLEEAGQKDQLVLLRDGLAAEKDRLIEKGFAGSIEGLDTACADLESACERLKDATDRIATTKKVIEVAGRALALAAKAASKLS